MKHYRVGIKEISKVALKKDQNGHYKANHEKKFVSFLIIYDTKHKFCTIWCTLAHLTPP